MSRTHRTGPKFLVASVKWGEYSRWSSFIYCSMRKSDEMTIGRAHPTLDSRVWIFVCSFVIKAANVKFFILLWPHVQLCWHIHRVIFTFQSHYGQEQDFHRPRFVRVKITLWTVMYVWEYLNVWGFKKGWRFQLQLVFIVQEEFASYSRSQGSFQVRNVIKVL